MKKNEEFGEKEMNEIVSKSGEIWKVFEKLVFLHEKIVGIEQKIRRFRLSIGFFLLEFSIDSANLHKIALDQVNFSKNREKRENQLNSYKNLLNVEM